MVWCAKRENVTPPPKASAAERLQALRESTWALVLPVIVLVGLKFGVFTPTEAAVVAAVYALFVAMVVYRELKLEAAVRGVCQRRQDHRGDHVPGGRGHGRRPG